MIASIANLDEMQNSIGHASDGKNKPVVLMLSSSLLDDRKLLYSNFLDSLGSNASIKVWATSAENPRRIGNVFTPSAVIENFPTVRHFAQLPAFPYNYLRRLNQFAWDCRQRIPTRVSRYRNFWDKTKSREVRILRFLGSVLASIRAEGVLENYLEKLLLKCPCSPDALRRLQTAPPVVLIATGPNRPDEPPIVAAAKSLGIPTLAVIHSFDNLSTKSRMIIKYDGYLVWSEQMKRELQSFYAYSRQVPIYVVGAVQFDMFFQERFRQSREDFCASQGLRADKPIIVYALGSPNFLREYHGAIYLAKKVERGELGDVQLLIRPHPQFDKGKEATLLREYGSRVVVQQTSDFDLALPARFQDERHIIEWVNTFRHADVVVNLSSTVTIDAAIFDRPVVNLDYDPEPGHPNQAVVKDVNHIWTHFKPIAESGGVWLVNNPEEMVEAVKTYLAHPELHREKRRWIAEYVCGYLDGKCGERLSHAILDFVRPQPRGQLTNDNFLRFQSDPAPSSS